MKNYRNKLVLSIFLSCLFLSGCSSPPRHIEATVPLVESSYSDVDSLGQELPLIFWKHFSVAGTARISEVNYNVFATKSYISALGLLCRNLTIKNINSSTHTQRIACTHASQDELTALTPWYLTRDIKKPTSDLKL
ncbi:hypothetical protein [Vibrio nitrifigilis]|uniref:Outer membrane lipoprotein n=1 Tax=Vibrio nitrifigilis TaxID=2789781 RepID=A0ABS0GFQ4_9VIBR|nr:hypothetical protein [Vibrio nitrifigilis]MBF9001197.1 hypothetical protein [Vibrio nitrifigilis]